MLDEQPTNPTAAHPDVAIWPGDLPPFTPTDRALDRPVSTSIVDAELPNLDGEPAATRAAWQARRDADREQIDRLSATLTRTEQERDQAREFAADSNAILDEVEAALTRAGYQPVDHGIISGVALLTAERDRLQGVVRRQAAQIQRDGTLIAALREHDEDRDRLWAAHEFEPELAMADPELAATHRQIAADAAQLAADLAAGRVTDEMGAPPPAATDAARDLIAHIDVIRARWATLLPRDVGETLLARGAALAQALAASVPPAPAPEPEVETLRAERALIVAVEGLPQEPAQPATIAAERPADSGEGDGMPDPAETVSAGRTKPAAYHMTRGTRPGGLEADCPCGKAPCGYVDSSRTDPSCDQHPAERARTMRSMHRADVCPAEQSREG